MKRLISIEPIITSEAGATFKLTWKLGDAVAILECDTDLDGKVAHFVIGNKRYSSFEKAFANLEFK